MVRDLGTLAGRERCSNGQMLNEHGDVVGNSEINTHDPVLGFHEIRAVRWRNGQIIDLGTLGGNNSAANVTNNSGQIVGFAMNGTPDPFSLFAFFFFGSSNGTQTRGFLWQDGVMHDLGSLGGPDAWAVSINDHQQITGFSYTNSTPNAATGLPTVDPFFWEDGKIVDLGTLGGVFGQPVHVNQRGQVTGTSNLAGDQTFHPFFWDRGLLTDVGTLGGSTGQAMWINDAGEVVGGADLPGDEVHDAFLWKHGVMIDLGNLGKTSFAHANNNQGQVVGASRLSAALPAHAFLWENGGPMVDLNDLIPRDSSLLLNFANAINERGIIAGNGLPPECASIDDGCGHAFVLIPDGDAESDNESRMAVTQHQAALTRQNGTAFDKGNESPVSPANAARTRLRAPYENLSQSRVPRD
jgi:probable HAF family extracellular repeat protein